LFIKSPAGFAASMRDLNGGAIGPVIEEIKPNLKVFAWAAASLVKKLEKRNVTINNKQETTNTDPDLFTLSSF
jgi:hypothetical protein